MVRRAFQWLIRNSSRKPTPEFDPRPNTAAIDGVSVERVDESRIRNLLDMKHLTTEKLGWRRFCSVLKFVRREPRCKCVIGYPSRCRFHKAAHRESAPPDFYRNLEEDTHWQLSSSLLRLPTLDFGADLERKPTQGTHAHLVNHSQDEIGVAWPLGPEHGVLPNQGSPKMLVLRFQNWYSLMTA